MTGRARKVCSHVDADGACTNLQPCADHAPQPWASSNRRAELPPGWSHRIVPRILGRDPICTLGIVCRGMALSTEVHHTGDPHDHRDEMLAGTCRACHTEATSRQAAEARSR